jgi:hypothetical protein
MISGHVHQDAWTRLKYLIVSLIVGLNKQFAILHQVMRKPGPECPGDDWQGGMHGHVVAVEEDLPVGLSP